MFFWFIGTSIATVRFVFQDSRFDHRLLIIGALLPLVDLLFGRIDVLHTLVFSLLLLAIVMLATLGRRPSRALLLGLPIGTLLHLVFDGAWTETDLFWWPVGGWSFEGVVLPEAERGLWNVPLELVGLAILVWVWRSSGLSLPSGRHRFWAAGRLFERPRGL